MAFEAEANVDGTGSASTFAMDQSARHIDHRMHLTYWQDNNGHGRPFDGWQLTG